MNAVPAGKITLSAAFLFLQARKTQRFGYTKHNRELQAEAEVTLGPEKF